MNTRHLLRSISLLPLLALAALAATPDKGDREAVAARPPALAADKPESTLKQAMTAEEVRRIMGAPEDTRPMKTPTGKAEIWVFRREVGRHVDRLPIGSIPLTSTSVGSDGQAHTETIGETIQYADVHIVTVETVELLMFNDHYLTHKVTRQEVKHYN